MTEGGRHIQETKGCSGEMYSISLRWYLLFKLDVAQPETLRARTPWNLFQCFKEVTASASPCIDSYHDLGSKISEHKYELIKPSHLPQQPFLLSSPSF